MSATNNDKHNVTERDMDNKRYVSESQLLADNEDKSFVNI